MKYKISLIHLLDRVDYDSESWKRTREGTKFDQAGFLGYVVLAPIDQNCRIFRIPIVVVDRPEVPASVEVSEIGKPLRIVIGNYDFLNDNGIVKPAIYHELGHIYNGDTSEIQYEDSRDLGKEIAADMYAVEHCGRESVIGLLTKVAELYHDQTDVGYLELKARLSTLDCRSEDIGYLIYE